MFLSFCRCVTLIAGCIASLVLTVTVFASNGAPQEAAGAALALAICVIPYVFTRMVEGMDAPEVSKVEIWRQDGDSPATLRRV